MFLTIGKWLVGSVALALAFAGIWPRDLVEYLRPFFEKDGYDALGKALDLRRQAFAQLEAKFSEWQSQREQLALRIETLKIRHQTASLSADADTSTFDGHLQT